MGERLDELLGQLGQQAAGAWPNGSGVVKVKAELGDRHPVGALGVLIGSIGPAPFRGEKTYGYFVRFEDDPFPTACLEGELRRMPEA